MDVDVVAHVVCRPRRSIRLVCGWINGYRLVHGRGAAYPFLVAASIRRVEGLLLQRVSPQEMARLKRFEGHEYVVGHLTVNVEGVGPIPASVFLPRPGYVPRYGHAWHFNLWRRRHKRATMAQLRSRERVRGGNA